MSQCSAVHGTRPAGAGVLRAAAAVLYLLACGAPAIPHAHGTLVQAPRPDGATAVVHVARIGGVIDMGLAPYVQRVIREAGQAGAAAVVLDIDTFGGRVDAAVRIRDALLDSPVRTIAVVNRRAISAGALIALATHEIYMLEGSTIGAAAPVLGGQPGAPPQAASEKTVSYVRKEFGATAQARGRDARIAEAMVDADVEIAGLVERGKLLTLTTGEAAGISLATRVGSLDMALAQAGLGGVSAVAITTNWAEEVVRLLTHPVVSPILLAVAMIGILVEVRTPGFGIPGAAGLGSLGLFLWGHWLVQLAGWEELLLLLGGLLLLGIELLILPGFGVAGVLGAAALLAAFVMAMVGPSPSAAFLMATSLRVGAAALAAVLASLLLMRLLPRLPVGRRLVLHSALSAGSGGSAQEAAIGPSPGRHGRAVSLLRPAGIALIDGQRVDVVSEGEPVEAGESIEVIRTDGNRVVVRRNAGQSRQE